MCECGGNCGCSQPERIIEVTAKRPDTPPATEVTLRLDADSGTWLLGVVGSLVSGQDDPDIYTALADALFPDRNYRDTNSMRSHPSWQRGKSLVESRRRTR